MKRHGHNAPLRKAKGKDADTSQCQRGLVVSTHGRHVIVEDEQGQRLICHPRGKKSEAVVGDRVLWQPTLEGSGEGLIVQVEERRNLLYRQDEWRSKSFAANLDQMLVWIAVEPVFSEAQLTRALLAARYADIPVTIVLNKVDLPGADTARQRLAPYVAMGYPVVEMSLKVDTDAAKAQVMPLLQGKASLVLGPSGAGKSTLINTLLPNARGKVDLPALLRDLAQRGVNELHLEAGHKLNGSFLREGLVDELLLYLAPQLLGPGRGMADMVPLDSLAQGLALDFHAVDRVGPDLRILARVQGRDTF